MTPFFVMHLREPNLGVDSNEATQLQNEEDIEEKIEVLISMKTKVDDLVDKNIKVIYIHSDLNYPIKKNFLQHAQEKQKGTYDAKHNTKTNITLGDVVLVKNMKNTNRMGGKLDIRWTGPYEVIDDIGMMQYNVKCKKTGKTLKQILHCNRLKHYNHDEVGL